MKNNEIMKENDKLVNKLVHEINKLSGNQSFN